MSDAKTASLCAECGGTCCRLLHLNALADEDGRPEVSLGADSDLVRRCFRAVVTPQEWVGTRLTYHVGSTYTCDWLDWEKGTCTHYDERPPACRDYLCTSAMHGLPGLVEEHFKPTFRMLRQSGTKLPPTITKEEFDLHLERIELLKTLGRVLRCKEDPDTFARKEWVIGRVLVKSKADDEEVLIADDCTELAASA